MASSVYLQESDSTVNFPSRFLQLLIVCCFKLFNEVATSMEQDSSVEWRGGELERKLKTNADAWRIVMY